MIPPSRPGRMASVSAPTSQSTAGGPRLDLRLAGAWRWAPWLPAAWAAVLMTALIVAFVPVGWPVVDLYEVLYKAYALPWREAVPDAFTRGLQFRPGFTLLVKAFYDAVDVTLWVYKTLIVLQHVAIVALLVWVLQPTSKARALAACLAVSIFLGLHSSRILFAFFPIGHHSLALLLLLLAMAVCLAPRHRLSDWLPGLVAFTALMLIELGVIVPPLVTVLWLLRAPGASRRGVTGTWVALAVYAAIRLTFGDTSEVEIFSSETGLGFTPQVSIERLSDIFGQAPWLLVAYNVTATALSVLLSEPRDGVFEFVRDQLEGRTAAWQYLHLGSSVLATMLAVSAIRGWRARDDRDRQLIAAGVACFVLGCALAFVYARDRMGLVPGVGYVMLVYVAASALLERARPALHRLASALLLATLLVAWSVRDLEAGFALRDTAWESWQEWTVRWEELGAGRSQTDLLERLRRQALASPAADPRCDPAWTFDLLERWTRRPDCPR